jgi:predicted RNase H-like HicB family nuclease
VRTYTIVVEPDETGDLVVSVPALPGCFTRGKSLDECRQRAAEAIEVHIAGLRAGRRASPGRGRHTSATDRHSCGLSPRPQTTEVHSARSEELESPTF